MIEFDLTTPYFNGCNWIEWIGISFECLSTTVKIVGFYVFPQKYLIADFLFSQTLWILFDYSQMTWIRSNGNIFSETALAEWVTRKLLKLKIVSLFSYLLCWKIDKMHENVGFTQNTLVFHALTFILLFYLWTACWWGPFGWTMLLSKTKILRSCKRIQDSKMR